MNAMTIDDYQNLAVRTRSKDLSPLESLTTLTLGLAGEAGEVADIVKKHVGHGHDLDHDKIVAEIGDVLWYCACLSDHLGVSLGDVAARNIEKLRKRYPEGFSTERSLKRDAG